MERKCTVSSDWELSFPENRTLLLTAPYGSSEQLFLFIIWLVVAVGFLVNFIGIVIVIQNRSKYTGNFGFFVYLGLADLLYLLSALTFFTVPYFNSLVTFDYPFARCYTLLGLIFFAQVFETGMILAVFVEAYMRICHKTPHINTAYYIMTTAVVSAILVPFALPGLFEQSTLTCVSWPDSPIYENFPEMITLCPIDTLTTLGLFIFQDIPAYWIALIIMTYCYYSVVTKINGTELKESQKSEIISNMRTRLFVFFLCQIVARVYNFANMINPIFDRYTKTYEFFNFVLRLLLILQSTLNPFVYFFVHDDSMYLVKKSI